MSTDLLIRIKSFLSENEDRWSMSDVVKDELLQIQISISKELELHTLSDAYIDQQWGNLPSDYVLPENWEGKHSCEAFKDFRHGVRWTEQQYGINTAKSE